MLVPKYLAEESRRWKGCINFPQHTWLYLHLHLCYTGCPCIFSATSPYGISPSPQLEGADLFAREEEGMYGGRLVLLLGPDGLKGSLYATLCHPFSSLTSAFLLPANGQYLIYRGPLEPGTAIKNSWVLLSCWSVG